MTQKQQAERNVRKPRRAAPPREMRRRTAAPRAPLRARLGAWRDQHLYGFFSSLGRLAARPWATALTVLVLGFALALPLLFCSRSTMRASSRGGLREAREVTVFLKPSIDAHVANAFAAELRKRDDVAGVADQDAGAGPGRIPPAVRFRRSARHPARTIRCRTCWWSRRSSPADADDPPLVAELRSDARVDLVQYDAAWRRTPVRHPRISASARSR